MADIVASKKALAVNPLKVSQPMGATLAFLGIAHCVPLEHGAQGCTAFSKVFFTRHFREPIPLQTTAMDHSVTVMGADSNVVEALKTVADNHNPQVIGLVTTGLSETQGADITRTVKEFRRAHPEHSGMAVVAVSAPDAVGCLETGFAAAVEAMIQAWVPESRQPGRRPRQVNILASAMLTPGDLEAIAEWITYFGLTPLILPDLGDSLDGHFGTGGYTTLTTGGALVSRIATMGESALTLVLGPSLNRAADVLKTRTGVPDQRFESLMGLDACDAFTATLATLAGGTVPRVLERQRAQLLDAMVDCHLQFGGVRAAIAADPDLLGAFLHLFDGIGIEVTTAVASARAEALAGLPVHRVIIGDLEDLETGAQSNGADLLIANSHAAEPAARLGLPLLRAGFPLHDCFGGFARRWVGYAGSRQTLFDLANLVSSQRSEITPYHSIYWDGTARSAETLPLRHAA